MITHRDDAGINLLGYAPVLLYTGFTDSLNDYGYTQYLAEEVYNRVIESKSNENPFTSGLGVPPPLAGGERAGAFLFNYDSTYKITYKGYYSKSTINFNCNFEDIYSMILKGLNERTRFAKFCFGMRYNARMGLIDEGNSFQNGKTYCVDTFKKIYP